MSNYHVPVEESFKSGDQKRKLECSYQEDEPKKPKLNTSLGLSLLKAYEGDISSDEDEDDWKTSNEETFDNVDPTPKKDTKSSVVDYDPRALMIEEEKEISLQESDVLIDKVDECPTNQLSVDEDDEETFTDPKNEEIESNKLNELDSVGCEEKSKNESDEAIHNLDPDTICIPSDKLDKICLEKANSGEIEKKPESIRQDFSFSIFGTEVAGSDSKPTKKVKLNRSKFVRPPDESSNGTRIPSVVNQVSVVDTILNVTPVIHAEDTPSESDNSINDSSNPVLNNDVQVTCQVGSNIESDDKTVQKVEIISESSDKIVHHLLGEESTSNNDVELAQQNQGGDEASDSEEPGESLCFISALEENTDNESIDAPQENLPATELVTESVLSPENLEQLITEKVTNSEPLEDESSNDDVYIASKDSPLIPGAVDEEKINNIPNNKNEDVEISVPMVDSDNVEDFESPEEEQLITEKVTNSEPLEDESLNEDVYIASKDSPLIPSAVDEEKINDIPNNKNEDVEISVPLVDSDNVEDFESPEEDHKEANVTVFDNDSNKTSSECIDEPEENLQESEIVELNEEVQMAENTYEDPAKPEIELRDDTEKPSAMEITNEFTNERGQITRVEEGFEDTMDIDETIEETVHDGMIEETSENVSPKQVEISKLEQALTGHMENFHPHPNVSTNQTPARKGRPPKVKRAFGNRKQNIKLHLSVQGDRVSILNNTQSTLETPSPPVVRVKRQYRKRTRVPGELEAKQANAKEYTHRLRQRTERETPGAKKRTRKKKNQESDPPESKMDPALNSTSADLLGKLKPLTVAINKLPEKVEPIKLKIRKNPNVTLERTSEYDVCLAREEDNRTTVGVNEKVGGILDEVRRKEESPSLNDVEKTTTPLSEPDLQRVERFLKESNVTITPVASVRDLSPSSISLAKPIVNLPQKFKTQVTPVVDPTPATSTASTSENDENSKNLVISLKADADERNSPWKIVKSPQLETASSPLSFNLNDMKSEIRKKIASLEKRKQDVNTLETESMYESQSLTETQVVDLSLSSSESDAMPEDHESDNSVLQQVDIQSKVDEPMPFEFSPVSVPTVTKTPAKLPRLPVDLFPKKRGRPTKEMVAAREAYWQQQEKLEKSKRGDETDAPIDVSVSNWVPTTPPKPVKIKKVRKMKSERVEKKDSDDLSHEELSYNPDREAEEQKRVEEERIRKEEERERKNELRRLRAKERSDIIKAKRLRQKMKAKERHKMAKEQRRLQQEAKKKLEEQLKSLPTSNIDDETRMSAENSQAVNITFSAGLIDDDSSSATNDLSQKLKKSRLEIIDPDSKDLMVDQIAEYQWPIQGGDLYMIQEQVSNFLGVKSFKRKYPDIWRRPVDSEERAYLVDSGLVSETLCDLGITAVRSVEVLDIMCSDFPEKYEEFRRYMRDKQMKELSFKQRAWANGIRHQLLMADGSKQDMKKRAMESVSNWNSALNKSRVDDRRCHMDLQTFIIHYPKQRGAKMTVPTPKVGSYPVPILPSQYCDFYKEYTPTELRYLPVNTVLYGPLKHPSLAQNDYVSQTDSDDSSSSDDSSTTSEDTQATEETLEDLDSNTVFDGNNLKFEFKDASSLGDEEQTLKEMNGDRDPLAENGASKVLCKICLGDEFRNKINTPEVLISCSQCASANHPTCLDLSLNIVPRIKSYAWQCPDCKVCAQCKENADEDKMLFCDTCDQGYHIYCVGLIKVPVGNWQCKECSRLKEHNGNIVNVDMKKEYIPVKKEVPMDFQMVAVTD